MHPRRRQLTAVVFLCNRVTCPSWFAGDLQPNAHYGTPLLSTSRGSYPAYAANPFASYRARLHSLASLPLGIASPSVKDTRYFDKQPRLDLVAKCLVGDHF
jgi:hypothetical protein